MKLSFRWLLPVVLAVAIAAVALPDYLNNQWPWQSPPQVPQISNVRNLRETGIELEGWSTVFQDQVPIGGGDWLLQQLQNREETAPEQPEQLIVFLRPQTYSQDQPEVEWVDLRGAQRWRLDSQRRRRYGDLTVDTFRAWSADQTFAGAQWYALPQGGHPAPARWFWRDQLRQWTHGQRLPWVAVTVLMPIPPLEDISQFSAQLARLSQAVQAALTETLAAFVETPSSRTLANGL